jgi:hypothetical protein
VESHRHLGQPGVHVIRTVEAIEGPYVKIPGYSYNVARDGRFLLLKSEYQSKPSIQLQIVENWRTVLYWNRFKPRDEPVLTVGCICLIPITLASQESSSWNTLLKHLKTLDSLRQCFTAT